MPEQVEAATQEQLDQQSRELPDLIVIPSIKGEMVHLRPSVIEDLERMDAIGVYIGASGITGKDRVAERGAVHAWVRRSVAWSNCSCVAASTCSGIIPVPYIIAGTTVAAPIPRVLYPTVCQL